MRGVKVTGPKVTISRPRKQRRPVARATNRATTRNGQQPQVVVVQQPRRFLRGPAPVQVQVPDVDERPARDYRGSTLWRNGAQLTPLTIPATLLAAASVLQLAVALGADRRHLTVGALAVSLLVALAAAKAGTGRLHDRWRSRVIAWALAGPTWLIATTATGLSWAMVAALVLATAAITSRWWAEHRPGHPTHPPRTDEPPGDVPPAEDDIIANFNRYAACPGGPADGCVLEEPDITEARSAYTMRIRPGKDSLDKMLQRMDVLSTAVHHLPEQIMLEMQRPAPGKRPNPNLLRFTVITHSPVADTVPFTDPGWQEDGNNAWIEAGTWADGDGRVRIPVLAENSARNVAILAPMGGGKSSILNILSIGALSSGRATILYLDGKGGASSPTLTVYSDWAPGGIQEPEIKARGRDVLTALERLAEQRRVQQMIDGVDGLNPTPDMPLVILVMDECHVFLDPADKATVVRWNKLLRLLRALGVCVWAATQYPNVNSFGGDSFIKEALMGHTTILGRFTTGVAKGLLNTAFDPKQLPDDGGYFFLDSKHGRSAMWRADFVSAKPSAAGARDSEADNWYKRYRNQPLEKRALAAMPTFYTRRAELAAEAREALLRGDDRYDVPAERVRPDTAPSAGGGWEPQWPTLRAVPSVNDPTPHGLTGRLGEVWAEIAVGHATVGEISAALDLGSSQVYEYLTQLKNAGHVRPVEDARGHYEITPG